MFLPTAREIYEDLVAGRFAQATYTALESLLRPRLSFEATRAIREGRFYEAICILGRDLEWLDEPHARDGDRRAKQSALADCRWGFA